MAKKKKKLGALILGNAKKSADTKKNAKKKTTAVSKTKKVANTPAKPLQKTVQQVKTATQKSAQKMATLSKQTEDAAKKSAAEKKQKKTEEKKKQAAVVQARKESQSARVAAIKNSAGKTQSHKKGGAELAQKEVAKRPVVLGVSNAMNIAPVDWDEGFTDEAKKIAKETKKKTSYKVAYGAGTAASFLVPGAASKGVSNALLKGGKNASKVEKFVADRAADTIVSTPLNVKEAIKTGREGEEGFDTKAAAKSLAVNTGLDLAIGGGIDAGAAILKKKNSNKIINIMAKQKSGAKLTDAETKFYNKEMAKIKTENVARAAQKAVEEVRAGHQNNRRIKTDDDVKKYLSTASGNTTKKKTIKEWEKGGQVILRSEDETKAFISKSIDDLNVVKQAAYGQVNSRLAKAIKDTNKGIDVKDYYLELNPSDLRHAFKHSVATKPGELPITRADMENIPNYIDDFTDLIDVVNSGKKKSFVIGTRVNGYTVIVEMVSDGRKAIKPKTMYKVDTEKYIKDYGEKIKKYANADAQAQRLEVGSKGTPSTVDITSSNDSVTIPPSKVNENKKTAPELVNMADAPHPTSKTIDPSAVNNSIADTAGKINDADDAYKTMTEDAYNYPGKQYDNAAEKTKGDNPSPQKALENSRNIDPAEVPHVRQTAVKLANQAEDDVAEIMEPWIREGLLNKAVFEKQADAVTRAEGELADGRLYKNFMESSVTDNEHLFMARAKVLLEDLTKRASSDNAAAEELLHVMDKATEASSHAGRLLNATKLLLRNTPQGRLRTIQKEVEGLNKKFSDRFKGKEIELTDDQITRILKATDDNIEEVAEQINKEIWEKIPASGFEKFNEFRHASMLFNPKTHIRNLTGNFVFKLGREMSNAIEVAAYHIPAVKKRVENLGGKVEMVHVPKAEIKAHKEVLDEIFAKNYKNAESKNRYIESARPDGAPIIKNRAINKVVQTNYGLLEKEDMLMFKPEYRKNFARWCKANNVPLDKISEMSKKQMAKANNFAMKQAEIATFRDNSAFANKIIGLKQKTATKKGKTIIGTTGYRAANVVLESNLPFVKTPVNILKRSADYSPVGLGRSFVELATAKNADDFMQGVHHLSTGLTGSGICALGMWLANNDLITVRAGEESGDAYYDRDMGYQDWSLVVADGKYSVTIDWLSPLQTSLFMGATMWNNIEDKSLTLEDGFECLMAITGPMLDMSFMSTSKDTIETFMEKVYRNGTGDDADWSGAIMQTLLGSIPQGYLNSFVPQILTQTAQAFDSKQRDTRSTKESSVAASWDSWSKKMINKIPGLRNYLLNPKLDRFGEDVETGNNVVLRFINAYMNPSNVKKINMTELDKVIIEIYNNLEDENQKKYYYYNFTGNPSYDLGDGKRMSYDELYAYGKEKRREQTKLIQRMADSASFEFMTWAMKGDEVSDAHWISQTQADFKTYGADYAVEKIVGGNETEKEKHTLFKRYGGDNEDFVSFYLEKEKLVARAHDTSNYTKAMAIAVFNNDKIAKTYGVYGDKLKAAKKYLDSGGTGDAFADTTCRVVSVIKSADVSNSIKNKAVAAAITGVTLSGEMYNAMGIDSDEANMGYGLMSMGYSFDALEQMKADALFEFDADNNNSLKKSEIISYIDSLGLDSQEEKACLFRYFSDSKNPYGSVPNYLKLSSGSYGSSRGSGSGKGKSDDSDLPAWEDYVKDFISNSEKVAGVNFKDWDSPLDSSYRKKIQSILDDSRVS